MGRSYFEKTDCDNKNVVKKTVDDKQIAKQLQRLGVVRVRREDVRQYKVRCNVYQ